MDQPHHPAPFMVFGFKPETGKALGHSAFTKAEAEELSAKMVRAGFQEVTIKGMDAPP